MSNTTIQLSTALAAARAAAGAIAHVGDPQAFEKGDSGPATVADLASQVAASLVLHELCGENVRLVAEEGWEEVQRHGGHALVAPVVEAVRAAGVPCDIPTCEAVLRAGGDPGGTGSFWAIDPLDGTKGYLRGGQFAIAIALVANGHPVVGVMAAPRLGERGADAGEGVILGAVRGGGAWQFSIAGGTHSAVHCRSWKPGSQVRLASSVEASHNATDEVEAVIAQLGTIESVRMDSQAKYGLVARGCADAYVRRSPSAEYVEHVWDHAAGALIALEAGCCVTDLRGLPLDFSRGRGLASNHGILCAAPSLHAHLVRAFQPALR